MRRALLIASLLLPASYHVASACDEDDSAEAADTDTDAAEPAEVDAADTADVDGQDVADASEGQDEATGSADLDSRVSELENRVTALEGNSSADSTDSNDSDDWNGDFDIDIQID